MDRTREPLSVLRHFERRLLNFGACSAGLLSTPPVKLRDHRRGADMTGELAQPPQIVISGWACQMRPDPRRRRQILGFILPGDVIGSFWRRPEYSFWRIAALTRVQTVCAGGLSARDSAGGFLRPDAVAAARKAEDYSQHLLVDHLVRLGARDAYAGLAHLLLELEERLARVGLSADGAFVLPVGQRVLAQAMGFSLAHTNQTLKRMVADGLFSIAGEEIRLLDRERMAKVGEFVPWACDDAGEPGAGNRSPTRSGPEPLERSFGRPVREPAAVGETAFR